MTAGVCIFKDITRRRRVASRAHFLFLGYVLGRVRGDIIECSRALNSNVGGLAALRWNQFMWHVVGSESAHTIEFSRRAGHRRLRFKESSPAALPCRDAFLRGALPLERHPVVSPVGDRLNGHDSLGLVWNVVKVAGAVQQHGTCRRDIFWCFLDFGWRDFPGLKAVLELSASLERSTGGHSGVCRPAEFCSLTNKTLKVTSVSCEILKGLGGWPVNIFGPCRLGLELIRGVVKAMACITVKRDCGTLDRRAGFIALPQLYLPRNVVILKCR